MFYNAGMVTKIGTGRRKHLYIDEWFEALKLNDEIVAGRMHTSRATVWRRRNQQHRLSPEKIAELADAMGIKPDQLWHLPSRPSIDSIASDAPDNIYDALVEHARRLTRR